MHEYSLSHRHQSVAWEFCLQERALALLEVWDLNAITLVPDFNQSFVRFPAINRSLWDDGLRTKKFPNTSNTHTHHHDHLLKKKTLATEIFSSYFLLSLYQKALLNFYKSFYFLPIKDEEEEKKCFFKVDFVAQRKKQFGWWNKTNKMFRTDLVFKVQRVSINWHNVKNIQEMKEEENWE